MPSMPASFSRASRWSSRRLFTACPLSAKLWLLASVTRQPFASPRLTLTDRYSLPRWYTSVVTPAPSRCRVRMGVLCAK